MDRPYVEISLVFKELVDGVVFLTVFIWRAVNYAFHFIYYLSLSRTNSWEFDSEIFDIVLCVYGGLSGDERNNMTTTVVYCA